MAHGFARTRQHQLLAGSIPWHRFSRLFSRWQSPSSLWQGQPAGELTTPSRSVRSAQVQRLGTRCPADGDAGDHRQGGLALQALANLNNSK